MYQYLKDIRNYDSIFDSIYKVNYRKGHNIMIPYYFKILQNSFIIRVYCDLIQSYLGLVIYISQKNLDKF